MGFTRNSRLQVVTAGTDRQIGGRIAHQCQIVEVTMRVAGFAFRGRAKQRCNVVLTFDVSLVCEI